MSDKKISQLTIATTPLVGTEVLPIVQGGSTVKVPNNDLRPKQIQSNATSGVLQVTGPADASTRVMTTPDANFTVARTDAGQTFTGDQRFSGAIKSAYTAGFYVDSSGTMLGRLYYSGGLLLDRAAGTNFYVLENGSGQVSVSATTGNVNVSVGNVVIGTSGKGIDFSATANSGGTMTSELLADYEEGTWTPTVIGTTTAGTATYAVQSGTYTKIGRMVYYCMQVVYSSHTGTGNMQITGLPYTVGSFTTTAICNPSNLTFSNDLVFAASASSTALVPFTYSTNASNAFLPIDTGANITVSGTYSV